MKKISKLIYTFTLLFMIFTITSCDITIDFSSILGNGCDHNYQTTIIPPTCSEQGYTSHKCDKCEDEYIDEYTAPLNHNYDIGTVTKEPTCIEEGNVEYKCTVCEYTYNEVLPLADHVIVFEEGKKPTCTSLGLIGKTYCKVCNEEFAEEEILDYVEHNYKEEIINPTCTSLGYTTYTCVECGHSNIDNYVDKLQHEFVSDKCIVCGIADNSTYKSTYGYEQLLTENNGENLQLFYNDIKQLCIEIHNSKLDYTEYSDFKVSYKKYDITNEDAIHVWQVFRADNPYYYWLNSSLTTTSSYINLIIAEEAYLYQDRVEQIKLINDKITEYLSKINMNDTHYNIALTIHDLILSEINYAYDSEGNPELSPWAHNILGVFDGRGSVCEGYAKAYQLLLTACGIENIFVTGAAGGVNHAWNLVKLEDGNWYWCDITWDDKPEWQWGIDYNFFMKNDTENVNNPGYAYITQSQTFLTQHLPNVSSNGTTDKLYDLPPRAVNSYNYSNDLLYSKFTISNISYAKIGYNKVIVDYIDGASNVSIPSSVVYNNKEYIVYAVGKIKDNAISNESILSSYVTKVELPSSVQFIADGAFDSVSLSNITVNEKNNEFASISGVLYTKDYYTLIKYPSNKSGDSFEIPTQVHHVAYGAFTSLNNLYSLKIGDNVEVVGVYNMGYNYHNSTDNNVRLSYFEAEFASIFSNLKSGIFKTRSLTISENNAYFVISNNVLYSYDYKILYFILSNSNYVVISEKVEMIARYALLYNTKLSTIYYFGTPEQWNNIDIHSNNESINSTIIYYYSQTKPNTSGNYWYLSGNEIKKW